MWHNVGVIIEISSVHMSNYTSENFVVLLINSLNFEFHGVSD